MDGIHDMGGTEGWGPIPYEPEEPIKVGDRWEAFSGAALFALLRSRRTNIDAHRHRIERLDPTRYLPLTYWGRWLAAVESATVDQGIASADEISAAMAERGHGPDVGAPPTMYPAVALESTDNDPTFIRAIDQPPLFEVGDRVVTSADAPHSGHHRLPRYARGRRGIIARRYPTFTFPDTVAHGRGENPTTVYAVAFDGRELWGPDGDPNQVCHLDLFEPYLRAVEDTDPADPSKETTA